MEIGNNSQLNNNIYSNANQALNRIATGLEINQASDDPSGLSILNNLQVQSSGLTQAIENSNSAVALTQIADSALSRQSTILDDVKEKLLQASTDTTNQQGREAILQDIQGQLRQLNDVASQTNYNGQTFLQNASDDSSASQTLQFQTSTESGNPIETTSVQSNTEGLDLEGLLNQDPATFDSASARSFLENVDNAINTVSNNRSEFAAVQNQLDSSTRNLFSQRDSTLNAASVFETNFAAETANFSKQNILAQVGAFGAAQSNNINQSIVTRLLS
ncbi:flagellin [Poseidonibacter lekithochrous]|uniref:flagellin N-terminal helical domain-containing protein n=1 Tax=Poseidonibacter lekithochrous TaxID=1904463 RepID=UPI0008FC6CF9|nr:flagellin [Poseidonibacter lekithochrous]QKJ23359.1 putative flagellar protein [Poseidonibacter lekithochrous]